MTSEEKETFYIFHMGNDFKKIVEKYERDKVDKPKDFKYAHVKFLRERQHGNKKRGKDFKKNV